MPPIICNTAHKSVTIPLGADIYAGSCYLSRYIPQALVAGLSNKTPTALVSLANRITTTLGRGVHIVGAIAFIAALHQIATRCSLKHQVQSGFRRLVGMDDYSQLSTALQGLPWAKMERLPLKEIRNMLAGVDVMTHGGSERRAPQAQSVPLVDFFSHILALRICVLLKDVGELKGKMLSLGWVLSGNEADKTLPKIPQEFKSLSGGAKLLSDKCILDLMDVQSYDETVAKVLTWITGVSFQTPAAAEVLETAADRANAYIKQLVRADKLFEELFSVLRAFMEKGASLGALQCALEEQLGDNWAVSSQKIEFESLASRLATNNIQSAILYTSGARAIKFNGLRLERARAILRDTNVKASSNGALWRPADLALVGTGLLTPGQEQWDLVTWLMGYATLQEVEGRQELQSFNKWTLESCKARIYECWSAQNPGGPLLEAEFLIAMVLANQTLPIFEVATGEGVVDEKATALHRARCLNTLGLAAEKFTYDPLINRAVAGLYPRGAASSQALGEYLKDQAIQWGEATNPNFIKALIDAGAKPPKLGSWSSDPTLVAAFKNLALWTYTNDALSWLTGINIITGNHVGGHQKTLFFEAVCRELVSADKALTPMRISAIEAYLHLVAFSEEFRHSLKETLTRSFRPQDLAEAKITAIDYALQKVKELQRRSDLQKPYLSALEILLKDPVTLSNYVQMQIAEVEGQTLEAYGDRLKSLMEVRFPSSADDQGHSILTYLVESGRSGLASDFLGALSQDKTVEEEPVRLVEAERLKAFVNYQAKVHEKAAPAEGEAAGALDIKQRSALRILTANTTPEEYSAGDHNLLIQLVSLGAEIPADVLLFEDAVKWFCTYSRPFSKTLEGFYSELKDRDNVTQVSEDALAKYPGDTEENAKAHALERCKLYAAALKVPYPLLDGFLNPALS